jgi:hypothetical protein
MNRSQVFGLAALIMGLSYPLEALGAEETKKETVISILRAEIAAKPSRVLIAVEDALTMDERAACEIIKASIEATRADAQLAGEITCTALKSAPGMAATIVECALAASPDSAVQIQAAMKRALGESAVVATAGEPSRGAENARSESASGTSGKDAGGKDGTEPDEDTGIEDFFDLPGIGVGGIYLFTPARGAIYGCDPHDPCCNGELSQSCFRP